MLASHVGASRFAFNWGLALVKDRLDAQAGGAEVEVPWSLPALRREWNRSKAEVAPWWAQNSKEAYNSGFDALARGLRSFSDSKAGRRKGRRVGFPRFRRRGRGRASCRFTTGALGLVDATHVRLPRIGVLRCHEPTSKLAAPLAVGTARILSAAVSCEAGRWFVAFTVEADRPPGRVSRPGSVVGVDAGVAALAVVSDGQIVPNPKASSRYGRRIGRLNRQLARRQPGSKRRASTRACLARTHAKVRHLRGDAMHQLTTRLARTHGTIVVEDLAVAGLTRRGGPRKRGLNRALLDAGLAELRRQLAYKCAWNGGRLVVADRWYPSSKTCSACGTAKAKLPLTLRTFTCDQCGLVIDRDLNAARNLAALAAVVAGSGPETKNGRGGERSMAAQPGRPRCSPTKRQAGTRAPQRDRTGTAAPQEAAAK